MFSVAFVANITVLAVGGIMLLVGLLVLGYGTLELIRARRAPGEPGPSYSARVDYPAEQGMEEDFEDAPRWVDSLATDAATDESSAGQNGAGQSSAGLDSAGQSNAGQASAGQSRAGLGGAGQASAGQAGAGQGSAGQASAGQSRAGLDSAGQSNAGPVGARQDSAGQSSAGQREGARRRVRYGRETAFITVGALLVVLGGLILLNTITLLA